MHAIRAFFRRHPRVAALVLTAALALRVLVPGGYMPTVTPGGLTVQVCTGAADGPGAMTIAVPGLQHHEQPGDVAHGKCAYADLAQAMAGGPDLAMIAATLIFALRQALRPLRAPTIRRAAFVRPPLRGPPAI